MYNYIGNECTLKLNFIDKLCRKYESHFLTHGNTELSDLGKILSVTYSCLSQKGKPSDLKRSELILFKYLKGAGHVFACHIIDGSYS
jgi:hypothetical protein